MKKLLALSIFMALLAFGCQDECFDCYEVIESNEQEAHLKCAGQANSYPEFTKLVAERYIGSVCKVLSTRTLTQEMVCDGVYSQLKYSYRCTK